MYVCIYVCMHTCMHACMYVCMYVCILNTEIVLIEPGMCMVFIYETLRSLQGSFEVG